MQEDESAANDTGPGRRMLRFGLSGKLLVLTILFVMLANVLIYVPLVANFRINWLQDRLAGAYTGALVLKAAGEGLPEGIRSEILASVRAKAVAMKMGNQRLLLALSGSLPMVKHEIDMRHISRLRAIMFAFETLLFSRDGDLLRVVGDAPMGGEYLELVIDEAPLRQAMIDFSWNLLLISLAISVITAALVYLALNYLFVRPMRRITANLVAFHGDPENPARIIVPSRRNDEIGTAERELAAMQGDIATMLHQKSRLAALGLAVSKINHDLRNLLASAQLFSDRLASVPDPRVQAFAPKLMRALERAIAFCQSTLSYGRAQEPPPDRRPVGLETMLDEVRETLGLHPEGPILWIAAVERGLTVDADADQLFRVLLNLARNALQALEARSPNDPARDQIRITGRREGAVVVLEVADTGPGLPQRARAHLFEAFQGSTRAGGSGLGLAIAAELVRAHGGEILLAEGAIGASFRLTIPDRAIELGVRRGLRGKG
jgi:signal transduction histidine kinase